MRSIWKGHIRFSLVTIPVQIFSAIESKGNVSFKQLHETDNGRVGYRKYCKSCDEVLEYDDIVKGFEYSSDQYVVFDKDELEGVKLDSTRAIDITAFVDIDQVHPSRFETVSFVGPDGDVAKQTFSLLNQTLAKTGKAGVGRVILRDKEDVVLLTAHEDGILMYKLRFPYEVRDINDVPDLGKVEVDDAQLKLAETLVESLSMDFSEVDFTDRYKDALMELVNAKVEGKEIVVMADEEEKPVVDIMSALKDSIEKAKAAKKSA